MSAEANKRIMQDIMAELAEGSSRLFVDTLADDLAWIVSGSSAWSRAYRGKQVVLDSLIRPVMSRLERPLRWVATRIVAEGEHVVVQFKGQNKTKSGVAYENDYCWVCRMANGKLVEVVEYGDTELVARVIGGPDAGVQKLESAAISAS